MTIHWPQVVSACADCGIGTIAAGEWYMVNDHVWRLVWWERKTWQALPGQQILCIGCLERRLGRTLRADDFIPDIPVNDPNKPNISARLRERLLAIRSRRRPGRPKGSKNKRRDAPIAMQPAAG
jgi:hypothetical protein